VVIADEAEAVLVAQPDVVVNKPEVLPARPVVIENEPEAVPVTQPAVPVSEPKGSKVKQKNIKNVKQKLKNHKIKKNTKFQRIIKNWRNKKGSRKQQKVVGLQRTGSTIAKSLQKKRGFHLFFSKFKNFLKAHQKSRKLSHGK